MSLFNWGIYIGYGLSYTVGSYVTDANWFDKVWKQCNEMNFHVANELAGQSEIDLLFDLEGPSLTLTFLIFDLKCRRFEFKKVDPFVRQADNVNA
jgi:hypothetical protein